MKKKTPDRSMVKTLQKKFILSAMLAITLLIVVLIGGINIFGAITLVDDNNRLLDNLADNCFGRDKFQQHNNTGDNIPPEDIPPDNNDKRNDGIPKGEREPMRFSQYIAVWISDVGEITRTDVSHIASVTEEEATSTAEAILSSGKERGGYDNFIYLKATRQNTNNQNITGQNTTDTVLIIADISAKITSFFTTLIISLIAGIVCWGLMFLLITLLSKKAIRPIAENIEKQKQFVTNAGHEIKTPLAIILANTDAMELISGETKWSKNIRTQVLRLNGLMQNLLTLSKMEEISAEIPLIRLDLSAVATDTISAFAEPAALKGLALETDITPDIFVNGSREHIVQLLTVLMDNAVKYTSENGKITVSLAPVGERQSNGKDARTLSHNSPIRLEISNTCPEIEKPALLFDRFYRGDAARTQKSGGYGIGLSVAEAIVKLHKGSIGAEYSGGMLRIAVRLSAAGGEK